LIRGEVALQTMETQIAELEDGLNSFREKVFARLVAYHNQELPGALKDDVEKLLKVGFESSGRTVATLAKSRNEICEFSLPIKSFCDAIAARGRNIHGRRLPPGEAVPPSLDSRVTLGCRAAEYKVTYVVLADALNLSRGLGALGCSKTIQVPGGSLDSFCLAFFEMGKALIKDCEAAKLPKIAVEAQIYFAKIARAFEVFCHASDINLISSSGILTEAEQFLSAAKWLTENVPFKNAEMFRVVVEETETSLTKPWFEESTPEETATIQETRAAADAYDGDWFMCAMGHPVSWLLEFSKCNYRHVVVHTRRDWIR
jgi:hypothetical protein